MAKPLFNILSEVSEADLAAIPPHRAGAQFAKFAKSRGAAETLNLLTAPSANRKTAKNAKSSNPMARASLQATLALAPSDTSGIVDTCGHCSTPGCRENCLSDSWQSSGDAQQRAQRIRTEFAAEHTDWFLAHLRDQQRAHAEVAYANQLHPVIRRNTFSDIPWHRLPTSPILIGEYEERPSGIYIPKELQHLPGMTTSEYSKDNMRGVVGDKEEKIPYKSVHITPSVSELTTTARVQEVLESGRNVAVPVAKKPKDPIPEFMTIEDTQGNSLTAATMNMDEDDARWADRQRGRLGVLTEKKKGPFGSGAYALNPHTNRYGFIRENKPGVEEDVPVTLRNRNSHFQEGHGR